jgi:hypothetical protein
MGGIGVRAPLRCEIVDGHRYPDDSKPSWYTGSQYARSADSEVSGSHALGGPAASTGSAYDTGVHERPSGAFRLPEQRIDAPGYQTDLSSSSGGHALPSDTSSRLGYDSTRIPVRGPEYPAVRSNGAGGAPAASYGAPSEPTSLVPPVAAGYDRPRPADSVYQTKRSPSSIVVAVGMAVLMVPVVRLLLQVSFTGTPVAHNIVPAVLLTLGLPLTGVGLFALAGSRSLGREAWLRPPVAYLPAGLLLLLAAGLAAA